MAGEGPNTPDQLDIVQQMNAALAEQNKLLQQIASAMGGQAQAAQAAAAAAQKQGESSKNAADQVRDLNEAIKENTGGSEALAGAMGKQSQATKDAEKATGSLAKKAGASVAIMGALSAAVSGLGEAFAAVKGAVNLFSDGIMSIGGIVSGALGVVGGFFSGLMGAAADYYNKGAGEIFAANEAIRGSFGDLATNQGAAVKSMVGEMDNYRAATSAAGASVFNTIGNYADILGAIKEAAEGFGSSFIALQDQIVGATSELLLMNKGMGVSYEAMKNLGQAAKASGGNLQDSMQEAMVASSYLSKQFGVDVKAIGKNFSAMAEDVETFGHLGPKALAATAAYAAKLGVEVSSLQGVMKSFDTFEDAAKNAGMLAEAFGMNIDAMAMMNAENPAERIDMLRASLQETGRSFDDLSRHEKNLMAQTMGMDMSSLTNAMSVDVDEMGFGDFEDAAEEAAQKMTPEEAMNNVAKSIEKMTKGMTDMTSGPFSEFMRGFMQVIERSPEFKQILKDVAKWLKEFFKLGQAVGQMFVDTFLKEGSAVRDMITGIFDLKKIQKFTSTVKEAFSEFFALIKTDPKAAVENLFDKVMGAFKDWFGGGEQAKGLGDMLKGLLINGLKIVAGLAPKIIKEASKYIVEFAKGLKDFLNGDNATANEIGDGIGGAFMEAFTAIKDAVVNDLGPALLDLFGVLFDKFGPALIALLGGIFTVILIKSIVSAAMAAAAGAAVKAGVELLSGKLVQMAGGSAGVKPKDASTAEQTASSTESLSESFKSMLDSLKEISVDDAWQAAKVMMVLAVGVAGSMVIFAIGMIAVAGLMMSVPWEGLAKGLVGMMASLLVMGPMLAAAMLINKFVDEKDFLKLGLIMMGLAVLVGVTGVIFGAMMIPFAAVWSAVDAMGVIKGALLMALVTTAMIPVIGVAFLLGALKEAMGMAGIGLLALGALIVITGAFGLIMPFFADAWGEVDAGSTLKGLLLLNALVLTMLPIIGVIMLLGAILGNPAGLLMAGIGFVALAGLMAVLALSSDDIAGGIQMMNDAFKNISLMEFMKATTLMLGVAGLAALMTIGGAALAVLAPVMLVAAVGIGAMGAFLEFSAGALEQAITAIANIKLDNPEKTMKVLDAVGKVVKVMGDMADIGLKAAKMAIIASIFGGGEPADMMTSMSDFMTGTIDSISALIVTMVVMASQFDEKALKGAEAIAGLIGAVANLAGAIMDPLIKVQENAGFFASGDEMAQQMEQMASSVGSILQKLQIYIPGIIDALIGSLAGISDPEAFAQKASALRDIFEGILALVNVVQKMNEMGQKDAPGWFTGTEFDETTITSMFGNVSKVLKSDLLSAMIADAAELVSGLGGENILEQTKVFGDVLKGIITLVKDLASFGQFLSTEGVLGLTGLKTSFEVLSAATAMPSDIITLVTAEANSMAANLGNLEADMGEFNLEPTVQGVLGYQDDRTFTIKPEAMKLTVKMNVKIGARDLAVAIAKGNEDLGGFFETTVAAQGAGLDVPGGA